MEALLVARVHMAFHVPCGQVSDILEYHEPFLQGDTCMEGATERSDLVRAHPLKTIRSLLVLPYTNAPMLSFALGEAHVVFAGCAGWQPRRRGQRIRLCRAETTEEEAEEG